MKIPNLPTNTCSLPNSDHKGFVLVLDVGTSGVKAFVFDGACRIRSKAYEAISKTRPRKGWVEQDPQAMLQACKRVLRKAVKLSEIPLTQIKGLGITNQREATILWDKKTGRAVYPIIGWEDTRTRAYCRSLPKEDVTLLREETGLTVDSYFSASKVKWILENVEKAQTLLQKDQLAFGTIDSWLLWQLCEEHPHVSDETNAARTLLYNIKKKRWSIDSLGIFDVPKSILPTALPSRAKFGHLKKDLVGKSIPVLAVCGDQQASTYAALRTQKRTTKHVTKITFGTGVFLVQTIGSRFETAPLFFTTLVPKSDKGSLFALETKLEGSAEKVLDLLEHKKSLRPYLSQLCRNVKKQLDTLPHKPTQLVIDGGVARDGIVVELLEELTGLPTCLQPTFDGTALGTALLVWDMT